MNYSGQKLFFKFSGMFIMFIICCKMWATEATIAPDKSYIWWEAEDADDHNFPESQAFAPRNDKEKATLSEGGWLQTDKSANGTASWTVDVPEDGTYYFWTRKFWAHGPFKWHFNDQPEQHCKRSASLVDSVQMRKFVCSNWVPLGKVTLKKGKNTLRIKADPEATAFGIDCWLLSKKSFFPNGPFKPGKKYNRTEPGWFCFEPDPDKYTGKDLLDLRFLNQKRAGDEGFLKSKGMDVVFEKTGKKAKFWGVNAGCGFGDDKASIDYFVKKLAKYGVNMVRVHSGVHDNKSKDALSVNKAYLDKLHYFVAALAKQGIYTNLSFYFPLWFKITDAYKLEGYYEEDKKTPFSLIFYHPRMQEIYKSWAKGLLTTKNPYTGMSLAEDPAVGIVEIVNEDGLFFWTFMPYSGQPEQCVKILEKKFGDWLILKYGSIDEAFKTWGKSGTAKVKGTNVAEGRVGLYHPGFLGSFDWAVKARNHKRAVDQVTFLVEFQRNFYKNMSDYFRKDLGVKGMISASNWHTVDAKNLAALEKYTYTVCDIIDRHGYFGGMHKGDNASWSVRKGHTYKDRSGLTEPDSLTKELQYGTKPHMISEYNYPTPNRFRTEGVYMASTYGSLTGTDSFFYFAMHRPDWRKTNTKFPVFTPAVMGQFPAFSYIYREGIVKEGPVVADFTYSLKDLLNLKGTDIVEVAYMDELRKKDIKNKKNTQIEMPNVIDPLAYYVGQVRVGFSKDKSDSKLMDLTPFIDHKNKTIKTTNGQLYWNWGKGYSTLNDPRAQAICGFLKKAGKIELGDVTISSSNEYGTIVAVAIDGKAIKDSEKILVQVMTEDKNYGFKSSGTDIKKIVDNGRAPLLVKNIEGQVEIKHTSADKLQVYALGFNGYVKSTMGKGKDGKFTIPLEKDVLYYMISK